MRNRSTSVRKAVGVCLILLGIVCIALSVGLIVYNNVEEKSAEQASVELLGQLHQRLEAKAANDGAESTQQQQIPDSPPSLEVQGRDCIGILSIPVLELELPVLDNWSYEKLKLAPCLYYGSCYEADFVIAAHNYRNHFGRLSALEEGDVVIFTDVLGAEHYYEVVLLETLPAAATKEMITSGFDLSLYTCTMSGTSRVTVRCMKLEK